MKPFTVALAILLCAGPHILTGPRASAAEFYLAPDGSDLNPGTRSRPFATPERARDEVRKLRHEQKAFHGPVNIWWRRGVYLRTNALELTAEDSGTADAPVVWRAYKNERVRLLGGRKLTGFAPVTDAAILARLPEEARSHVLQLDLLTQGITDFGEMKSRGFSRPVSPAHCELFFQNRPMTLARWPNQGAWAQIAGSPQTGKDEHGGDLGALAAGFFYSGDRPKHWRDISDLWVHGYWAWDWANSYEHVATIDTHQRLIKTDSPFGVYGFRKGQRFYFLNLLEELDQPGEWFLDRAAGRLYFWPPPSDDALPAGPSQQQQGADSARARIARQMQHSETIMSLLSQPLLKLTEVSNVTFRGLLLEATRGNAVEIRGGASNRIAGCLIRDIGNSAVTIEGGFGHGVVGCDIFDTGDGGISISGGDRQTLTPGGHFVENCHFARQGRWSKCYVPAVLLNGVGLRASHNLIHDHPHCAILFTGNDHLIDFNEIHHIALETGDVGAIYSGRDYTYRGNRIRYNYIHHTGGVGMGSMGIYMDDCVSGTEIFANIFFKVQRAAFLGGGCDHQVVNNIFVECNHAVELDGRGLDASPVWHEMVNDTMRKRLAEVPPELYRAHYPALTNLDRYYGPPGGPALTGAAFKGVPPEHNVVSRNICVGKWLNVYWHASVSMLQLQGNLTNTEPRFVKGLGDQPRATDFALQAKSPAWDLEFQPIPVGKIGLYEDRFRRGLPANGP